MDSASFQANGIVTLTTDFGSVDPYVGMMKGVILGLAPRANVVDLTHGVPPQDVRVGGFFVAHARHCFPRGTVHVVVVDPGVGSERDLLVAEDDGAVFLGPDNGVLSQALSPRARVHVLDAARFARAGASRTFHGRDVLAPAAARIVAGLAPASAGMRAAQDWVRVDVTVPRRAADGTLEVEVLCCDHYGNAILAATPADLHGDATRWSARVGARRVSFAPTYAAVSAGEPLLLVDSYGALEIAVRDGDARRSLGLAPGARVSLARDDGTDGRR